MNLKIFLIILITASYAFGVLGCSGSKHREVNQNRFGINHKDSDSRTEVTDEGHILKNKQKKMDYGEDTNTESQREENINQSFNGEYIVHVVKPGETYSTIAEYYYLTAMKIDVILKPENKPFNLTTILSKVNCKEPRDLIPGDKIFIPSITMPDGNILEPLHSKARYNYVRLKSIKSGLHAVIKRPAQKPETCLESRPSPILSSNSMYNSSNTNNGNQDHRNAKKSKPPDAEKKQKCLPLLKKAEVIFNEKDYLEARNQYQQALECYKNDCEKCSEGLDNAETEYLAECYATGMNHYHNNQWEKAISQFQKVIAFNNNYKDVNQKIQHSKKMIEERKAADGIYSRAIKEFNGKNYKVAARLFQKILQIDNTMLNKSQINEYLYKCHLYIGLNYYDNKEYLKSINELNTAIGYDKNNIELIRYLNEIKNKYVELHYRNGMRLLNGGDINELALEEAIKEFNLALSMHKNRKDILLSLEKAQKRLKTLKKLKSMKMNKSGESD